jgi:hypothetical protein
VILFDIPEEGFKQLSSEQVFIDRRLERRYLTPHENHGFDKGANHSSGGNTARR